ncbi:MAG TPA: GGDEF domain-containing protein [bacterium]|nr:GGDEF domain-containing protein [bacterium]
MTDKTKWLGIYLFVGLVPVVLFLALGKESPLLTNGVVLYYLYFAPYVGLFLTAILGWQINQTRIFWAALFLLGFYHYYLNPSLFFTAQFLAASREFQWGAVGRRIEVITAAFPLSLCILFLQKECRLWSDKSLARFLLAGFPFILFTAIMHWTPDTYQLLFHWNNIPILIDERVTPFAWSTLAVFLSVVAFIPDLKIKPFLESLAVTFIPFYLPVFTYHQEHRRFFIVVAFTAITLILLHSVLHMYWKKVYMDILTGVPNRQALDERLHTLSQNYSLAMVDIDHFKKFNDNYGHAEGDNALRMVAQHLEEHLGFKVYRYGGEEFCVVFEGESQESAHEAMDKTRRALEKRKFVLRQHKRQKGEIGGFFTKKSASSSRGGVPITISVGVASAGKNSDGYEKIIKKADKALYEAKEKGRNRVVSD